jgi:MFS family permease
MVPCLYGAWHPWQYYVIGALFGIGMGGPMPMYALLFREFFGQKAIGSILGVFTAMHSTGMALGGYLGGLLHDRFDGYS